MAQWIVHGDSEINMQEFEPRRYMSWLGSYTGLINHHDLLEMGMNAQVQNEVIKEPVFIVSPPRTATTILHRTMSLDRKRFRSFDFSEMTVPLPNVVPRCTITFKLLSFFVISNCTCNIYSF